MGEVTSKITDLHGSMEMDMNMTLRRWSASSGVNWVDTEGKGDRQEMEACSVSPKDLG